MEFFRCYTGLKIESYIGRFWWGWHVAEFSLTVMLSAAEIRVLKAALLVEVATLERYRRHDVQPEIWDPALSAARRVLAALSDKANKHLDL